MRAFAISLLALLVCAPLANAGHGGPVGCDIDDDLYNHCHAGPVHFVYGPLCVGVKVGSPAPCHDVRRILDQILA